jgi:hypothetical protein
MTLILNKQEQGLCDLMLPLKTESYTPIAHYDFIKKIQENCLAEGYTITDKRYWNNSKGSKLIGRYTLDHTESDLAMNIGFRNSYDKSMSAGFALGATVMVCSNGMISGEYAFIRKHTGGADKDLEVFANDALKRSSLNFQRLVDTKNIMKEYELNPKEINELMGRLVFDEEIIRLEQFSVIQKEYKAETPTFDYGVPKNNVWNLYNLCTYAVDQKTHPSIYYEQHKKLLSVFEETLFIEPLVTEEEVIFI